MSDEIQIAEDVLNGDQENKEEIVIALAQLLAHAKQLQDNLITCEGIMHKACAGELQAARERDALKARLDGAVRGVITCIDFELGRPDEVLRVWSPGGMGLGEILMIQLPRTDLHQAIDPATPEEGKV